MTCYRGKKKKKSVQIVFSSLLKKRFLFTRLKDNFLLKAF